MQTEHLPQAIVAPSQELTQRLSQWAADHPDSTLAEQEQAVLQALRASAPQLLGRADPGDAAEPGRASGAAAAEVSALWRRRSWPELAQAAAQDAVRQRVLGAPLGHLPGVSAGL